MSSDRRELRHSLLDGVGRLPLGKAVLVLGVLVLQVVFHGNSLLFEASFRRRPGLVLCRPSLSLQETAHLFDVRCLNPKPP